MFNSICLVCHSTGIIDSINKIGHLGPKIAKTSSCNADNTEKIKKIEYYPPCVAY